MHAGGSRVKNRYLKVVACALLALAAMLLSALAPGTAAAQGVRSSTKAAAITTSAHRVSAPSVAGQSFNLYSLPTANSAPARSHQALPILVSPKLAQAKQTAAHNLNAPVGSPLSDGASAPPPPTGFNGMADSATICPYFGGCQPPDMALATSPQLVMQGVNTSYAFYNTQGGLVAGPFNSQVFFHIPNPAPAGCDPAGPFTSDPRAFYDPNDGYIWTAMLQVENAVGIAPGCNFLSRYWVANINVKTGAMCVYNFDMALGTTNAADFTQFGFNGTTIGFTGNMFNQAGTAYEYAEAQFVDKHAMEQCKAVTPVAFTQLNAGGVLVDTVQPVDTETTPANDPGVLYLVNSFNMDGDPNGDDCLTTACQGFVAWAYDPTTASLGGASVGTGTPNPTYIIPANADEPGCFQCVVTDDARISATPVYSVGGGQGLISFSLNTNVNNGGPGVTSIVPGILWGQIEVQHFSSSVLASLYQSGYLSFSGDRAAYYGAEMQDQNGNLFMVFDTSSANLNPSIMLVSRARSDPLGTIGHATFIVKGPSATFDSRWGDYEAASYTGFSTNHVWVASQYSVSGDWNTFIARVS